MNVRNKFVRQYKQLLEGSREEIFPLLCPVREKEWLQGWNYRMIYSESGYAEKGCVFDTNNDYGSYRWVITKHDKQQYEIQFVKTMTDKVIVVIDISLKDISKKQTACDIQYSFIPLSAQASLDMHEENTESLFNAHMKLWEISLNFFLKHSVMLIDDKQ